jgi:dTDP-4-amino-4,6-dideoxygalactose transaminase
VSTAIPFGDLSREYRQIRPAIDAGIARVLERGWFILGDEVAAFEAEFAAYLGTAHAVGVGNGTDALRIALEACGVRSGDEVVTVPFTAVPTVTAIDMLGARPRFVDVDAETATMDPALLGRALSEATKAILPVHLYGGPCDMSAIVAVADAAGVPVIEDAAQAHGAKCGERRVGTIGRAGCFSFYPSKNLGAYGDGGAVVTDDARVADCCRMLRNYGQRRRYEHLVRGVNSRLDEVQAAILRAKLPLLEGWNRRRCDIAGQYDAAIIGDALRPLLRRPGHVCHLYSVVCRDRDAAQAYFGAQGIGTQVHYPLPVHLQPAFRHLGAGPGSYPVAEDLAARVLSLPMHAFLSDEEVSRVCEAIAGYCLVTI